MSTTVSVQATQVTFPNQFTSMAGTLFAPPDMEKTKKYPALVVVHPFGGVKEQTAGIYAGKMAEKGYLTLAFDASHQGESGGYPRDTENPAERMEDIRCAIDYLTTLPMVDEDRIGLLGVCAGGSYVLGVAPTEVRAKAIASISLWDLGMMAREGWPVPYDRGPASWRKSESRVLPRPVVLPSDGTTAYRKRFRKTHPRSSKNPTTITGLQGLSIMTLGACSYSLTLHGSWISTTTRKSKIFRRVRYCSSSGQRLPRFHEQSWIRNGSATKGVV
jgi:hypothetical protein